MASRHCKVSPCNVPGVAPEQKTRFRPVIQVRLLVRGLSKARGCGERRRKGAQGAVFAEKIACVGRAHDELMGY
jgi:hypothetical protein